MRNEIGYTSNILAWKWDLLWSSEIGKAVGRTNLEGKFSSILNMLSLEYLLPSNWRCKVDRYKSHQERQSENGEGDARIWR